MQTFTLSYPGTWLTELPERTRSDTETLVHVLQTELDDAAVGLALYQQARTTSQPGGQPNPGSGSIPRAYQFRLPFIHAHTVMYALEHIAKMLRVLAETPALPTGITAACDTYSKAVGDLTTVRDSAHHIEDRARGLDKNKKTLQLQPVANQMIKAPNGVLGLSNLTGDRLGYTTSDGRYREAEISAASVKAAQDAIQQVINALTWTGPGRTTPW